MGAIRRRQGDHPRYSKTWYVAALILHVVRKDSCLTKLETDVWDLAQDADVIFDALFSQSIISGGDILCESPPDVSSQLMPSVRTYPDDGAMYVLFLNYLFHHYSPHPVLTLITFSYILTFPFSLHQRRSLETRPFHGIRTIWMGQEASQSRRHPSVWPSQRCWH